MNTVNFKDIFENLDESDTVLCKSFVESINYKNWSIKTIKPGIGSYSISEFLLCNKCGYLIGISPFIPLPKIIVGKVVNDSNETILYKVLNGAFDLLKETMETE